MGEKEVVSDPMDGLPNPGMGKKPVEITPVRVKVDDNKNSAMLILYLMFKGNLITNHNLKHMIEILNEELPKEGIAKFLVNQAAKA